MRRFGAFVRVGAVVFALAPVLGRGTSQAENRRLGKNAPVRRNAEPITATITAIVAGLTKGGAKTTIVHQGTLDMTSVRRGGKLVKISSVLVWAIS